MHILIAEKNLIGRRMLNRILKMEGHEVSVAESGVHALALLAETRPSIVLMNVFQCMQDTDAQQPGRINVRLYDAEPAPVMLVTCRSGGVDLGEFMAPENSHCDAAFDFLPAKVKSSIMDKIQQMCGALKQASRFSSSEGGFNWQRFSTLMDWESAAGNAG